MHHRLSEEITFRKLEVLLACMETGNLTRAAELRDVSTVSAHHALHSLEEGGALQPVPARRPQPSAHRCRASARAQSP